MNYVPINGLRMLAVESCLLGAAFTVAFLVLRFVRPPMTRPRWVDRVLARSWRAVLFVTVVALAGRPTFLGARASEQTALWDYARR